MICLINVNKIKDFEFGTELKIVLVGQSSYYDHDTHEHKIESIFLVNNNEVKFIQNPKFHYYEIDEQIKLIRDNIKVKDSGNGIMFNKHR